MQNLTETQTGGYQNSQRLRLYGALRTFNNDTITYNRSSQKVKQIDGQTVNRFVYAYGSVKMAEVSKWVVDSGGRNFQQFDPLVKAAIANVLQFNADMNGGAKVDIRDLSRLVAAKVAHMSLFGFIDAVESLIAGEEPCAADMYGFKADTILKACNKYWAKAKSEYTAFEVSKRQLQYRDQSYENAVPMPPQVKEAIKVLEEKHGVVYDNDDGRGAMREAARRWKEEHGTLEF